MQTLSVLVKPMRLILSLTAALILFSSSAYARDVIDARNNVRDAIAEYRAIVESALTHSLNKRIYILIDGRHGFDVGRLKVPSNLRNVNINVVIYVYGGRRIMRPITINLFELEDRNNIYRINQSLVVRG